ncbi:hypothetical protein EKL29_21350 [Pantoea sp. YU22]|uniref:Ref family recombination enhancement nuclease n=1 Tax=Pantoea sp. YU22 TaxID=2497684 RepID=UPI000F86B15A|nr:Ref family recombination enhancement nuclease [Pantoea sp. YU22]RTY53667.1 hypothetical protein EKL29_21350 [Pantoea sp. YU22]
MNGRTPTKAERLYIRACVQDVGCVACRLDGREIENAEAWTEFHHDPDFGSTDKNAHFRGFGLCATHHRGLFPSGCKPDYSIAVRHPILKSSIRFADKYGDDALLCAYSWELVPAHVKEQIGFDLSLGELPPGEVLADAI